jgi:hypothetical protein
MQKLNSKADRFLQYRWVSIVEMRPYEEGEDLSDVSKDRDAKQGDMIARNPKTGTEWLVPKAYFEQNFTRV